VSGVYLPLTAVADSMFLLTGAMEILEIADVYNARETNVWSCRIYKVYLLYYSTLSCFPVCSYGISITIRTFCLV